MSFPTIPDLFQNLSYTGNPFRLVLATFHKPRRLYSQSDLMNFSRSMSRRERCCLIRSCRDEPADALCAARGRKDTVGTLDWVDSRKWFVGASLVRTKAAKVLYVDGEMPLASLQERLRAISIGLNAAIPNDGFRVLAADNTENGIALGTDDGQRAIEPLLAGVDLLILDYLSTLCTTGSESESDAWVPMQNWLLDFAARELPSCSCITLAQMGSNGEHLAVRMLSTRSSHCGDPKITRPNRVHASRCTLRN